MRRPMGRPCRGGMARSGMVAVAAAVTALLLPAGVAATPLGDEPQWPRPRPPDEGLAGFRGAVAVHGGVLAGQATALEQGFDVGLTGAFYLHRNLGVEAGALAQRFDVSSSDANALSGGSVRATVAVANAVARIAGRRVAVYATGGVAYLLIDYEIDPAVVGALSDFNFAVSERIDDAVGFNVGGGVDLLLAGRFGLFAELRYVAASADTGTEIRDRVTGIAASAAGVQDLDSLRVGGGLRIHF